MLELIILIILLIIYNKLIDYITIKKIKGGKSRE